MNLKLSKFVFASVLTLSLFAMSANATAIGSGQFNLTGTIYATGTAANFGLFSQPPPGDQLAAIVLPATGPFAGLAPGTPEPILNLTAIPPAPTTALSVPNWISLSNGIHLDLQNILFDAGLPICTGTPADNTNGFSCRATATSHISLTQTATGVSARLVINGIAYTGTAATGSSPFVGLFASNFTEAPDNTISGLLGDFAANGFIRNGYELNISTTGPTPIPEPSSMAALGLALLGFGVYKQKARAKAANR